MHSTVSGLAIMAQLAEGGAAHRDKSLSDVAAEGSNPLSADSRLQRSEQQTLPLHNQPHPDFRARSAHSAAARLRRQVTWTCFTCRG